jgi:D-alanyl-D-alanine-carboxypeptidase/D-alanyl-D-alanine-endopeptidase
VAVTSLLKRIEQAVQTSRLARKMSPCAGSIVGVVGPCSGETALLGAGVDAGTPMEIGSLTKIFTALLIAEAVRRNELRLSSPIDEILFGQHWSGPPAISVEELATHTSGLPRLGLPLWKVFLDDPYRSESRDGLMTYLHRKRPRSPATRKRLYSNLGYAVLGAVAEKAAARPYAELLEERLFRPLGLKKTLIQFASGPDLAAPGYRTSGRRAGLWHWDAYAPCGGLVSTFDDLAKMLRSFLDPASPLSEALELSIQPRFALNGGGHIGLGWMLPAGGNSFWHNGGTYGYSSYLGVDSKQSVGVIVLANQGHAQETTELGTELMRIVRRETIPRGTE